MMIALARRGMAPGGACALTVVGRTSGAERTVPVTPVLVDGHEYLVAPYGHVGWVHNLRAARTAIIRRGRRGERIEAVELDPATAAPVLKQYVRENPLVRPQVAAGVDDPVSAFEAIADRYPVFLIRPVG
jgi:deazaflavin-dependent oxidoreductase (nitroreductase family)